MSTDTAASLAGQRRVLREQLKVQRGVLERELAGGGGVGGVGAGYPRSATMRWLIREPELAGKLVGHVVGGRAAAALPGVFLFVRFLSSAIARR